MKTLNDFYRDKKGTAGRVSACAECRRKSSKQYRLSHPDYFRNYQVENREKINQYVKEWSRQNSDKVAVYSARHLLRRQEALANCLPDDTVYKKQIEQLGYCEITGATDNLDTDHIMPVTRGNWGNNKGNLIRLFQPLNISKNSSNIFEWLDSMEQERLDYLLPSGMQMTVKEFRQKFYTVLKRKAEEKGLTLGQYKEHYNKEYGRRNNGKPE